MSLHACPPRSPRPSCARWLRRATLALVLATAGCASTSPREALDRTRQDVVERTGHTFRDGADDRVARELDRILARPLDVDDAVRVALLESADLRAELEEIAIGRAELVAAGLLQNPVIGFGSTAWETEHIDPNLFGTLEQNFLDLLTLPMRKRVAAETFEATRLRVAARVLEVAAETRHAYYEAQAAMQASSIADLVDEATALSADLARRRFEAGTANELTLASETGFAAEARVNALRLRGRVRETRETLTRRMGLWGRRTAWTLIPRLPELPATAPTDDATAEARVDFGDDDLEDVAIRSRLDVDAARRDVEAMDAALRLAKTTRWTGSVSVAVEAGRLRGSKRFSFGPSVALEIPLFDTRAARVAELEAHARQSRLTLRGLAVDVRSEVREARARVETARAVARHLANVLAPARATLVRASQERYDAMLLGAPQLIQARRAELETYGDAVEALGAYWIARSDLERAVGRRIGTPPKFARTSGNPSEGTPTSPPDGSSHSHSHSHAHSHSPDSSRKAP
ncbi:MAG: TolC family protein [Polyangiaceae bacterium]